MHAIQISALASFQLNLSQFVDKYQEKDLLRHFKYDDSYSKL